MITVHFHKTLQNFTNTKTQQFEVTDFTSLYSALLILFPKINNYIKGLVNNNVSEGLIFITKDRKILESKWLYRNDLPKDLDEVWLVPVIFGSGKFARLGIGVLLVAVAAALLFIPGGQAAGAGAAAASTGVGAAGSLASQSLILATVAKVTLGIGLNILLSTLLSLFAPKIDSDKDANRRNNDAFDALVTTATNGTIIPLNYGLMRVAGHIVSVSVATLEHDENTVINVNNEFFGGFSKGSASASGKGS